MSNTLKINYTETQQKINHLRSVVNEDIRIKGQQGSSALDDYLDTGGGDTAANARESAQLLWEYSSNLADELDMILTFIESSSIQVEETETDLATQIDGGK